MKIWLWPVVLLFSFFSAKCQYFHESADLFYNLRNAVPENKKFIAGTQSYSNLNFLNTIPNLLDNFRFVSRMKFDSAGIRNFKNLEIGIALNAFISGKTQIPLFYSSSYPMLIRVYDAQSKNTVISPGLQLIKSFPLNAKNDRVQLGLAGYYNFIGTEDYFTVNYPFAYDLSVFINYKVLSLQGMYSAHKIYSSYTFNTSDLQGIVESEKNRVSLAEEFENLAFITLMLGDFYLDRTKDKYDVLYNIYFSLRNNVPSNKDLRPEFKMKYIDYLAGASIRYGKFLFNPEFLINRRTYVGDESYSCLGMSMLIGWEVAHFCINAGYNHFEFYRHSTDYMALKEGEDITMDKLLISLAYLF
ncbi:MAG: hypothetical protein JW731_06755 [Bacteroidales bacterium]|nr:hypothetical protein [Bacteroidales bacterium]